MKLLLYISLFFLLTSNTIAGPPGEQDNLRTLFTSTHIRNQLDKQRTKGKFENTLQETTKAVYRPPVTVKMQGVVIRQNKPSVVFLNDSNTIKSHKINNKITVNTGKIKSKSYRIPVRVNQKNVKLRPGEQWNESEQVVQDNYQIKAAKNETKTNDNFSEEADTVTK